MSFLNQGQYGYMHGMCCRATIRMQWCSTCPTLPISLGEFHGSVCHVALSKSADLGPWYANCQVYSTYAVCGERQWLAAECAGVE